MKHLSCKILFFSVVAAGMMASSLWSSDEESIEKLPPILVTKQVLTEYVEDRLSQLKEQENLTEERAEELGSILANRDNPQKLAEFYGMEIEAERPKRALARQEPSARETQEESPKEISQSDLATADALQLQREGTRIDAALIETSESGEASLDAKFDGEVAEPKRAEDLEEKRNGEDMKGDEKATSPRETSSPLAGSGVSTTAPEAIPKPSRPGHLSDLDDASVKPSSVDITEEEVKQFFATYIDSYTKKDIDGFLSLFSPKAIQNWRNRLNEIERIYSRFFDQSLELQLHLEGVRIRFYQNAVEAKGRYEIDQILKKEGEKKVWRGGIRWILIRENGALKIRHLEYGREESPSSEVRGSTKDKTRTSPMDESR